MRKAILDALEDRYNAQISEADATLKKHSKHHSAKHMTSMKNDMKKGMSFSESHKKAMRKVGV